MAQRTWELSCKDQPTCTPWTHWTARARAHSSGNVVLVLAPSDGDCNLDFKLFCAVWNPWSGKDQESQWGWTNTFTIPLYHCHYYENPLTPSPWPNWPGLLDSHAYCIVYDSTFDLQRTMHRSEWWRGTLKDWKMQIEFQQVGWWWCWRWWDGWAVISFLLPTVATHIIISYPDSITDGMAEWDTTWRAISPLYHQTWINLVAGGP